MLKKNQSVGALVIYNRKEEDVRIDTDLKKFIGVGQSLALAKNLELA